MMNSLEIRVRNFFLFFLYKLPRMKLILASLAVAGSASSVGELVAFFDRPHSTTSTTTTTPIESVDVNELMELFDKHQRVVRFGEERVATVASVFEDVAPEGTVGETVGFFESLKNQFMKPPVCFGLDCSTDTTNTPLCFGLDCSTDTTRTPVCFGLDCSTDTTNTPVCFGLDCSTTTETSTVAAQDEIEEIELSEDGALLGNMIVREELFDTPESSTETSTASSSIDYASTVAPPMMLRGGQRYTGSVVITAGNGVVRVCTHWNCLGHDE